MRHHVFTAARAAVEPASPTHRFRMSAVTLSRVLCTAVLLLVVPIFTVLFLMVVARSPTVAPVVLSLMGKILGIGLLFEVGFAFLLAGLNPVRVSDKGVAATDFWGRSCTLTWAEMETVTEVRFMTLPYLKIASFRKERPVLWLPLFVTRPHALRNAIRDCASSKNVLRCFVENQATPRLPIAQ